MTPDQQRPGALAAIGSTPVVRLSTLPGPDSAEVWVKLEAANPTGSYKDRMALAMIEGAEAGGATAAGSDRRGVHRRVDRQFAGVRVQHQGLPAEDRVVERVRRGEDRHDARLGADVELIQSDDGIHPELIPQMIDQGPRRSSSPKAPTRPISSTTSTCSTATSASGEELVEQIDGEIHGLSLYVGVGGAFTGTWRPITRALARCRAHRRRAGRVGGHRGRPGRERTASKAAVSGSCRH